MATNADMLKIKRLVAWYNLIPIIFWSVLCLYPVTVFSYKYLKVAEFYIFLGMSFLPVFLPNKLIDRMAISKSPSIYKKLKINLVNSLAQNGRLINSIVRKQHPDYNTVGPKSAEVNRLFGRTYMYEKFHLWLFVYFLLLTVYAFIIEKYWWVASFIIGNIIYNIYPIFLQQYIRLRLKTR